MNNYIDRILMVSLFLLNLCRIGVYAQPMNSDGVIVATWNIGHFSNGAKDFSFVNTNTYNVKVKQYRDFLYRILKADVLCINEYESEFCQDSICGCAIAEDVLFYDFPIQRIFKKNRYICNAIFSNIQQQNIRKKLFKYDLKAKENIKYITWFYYVTSDIVIGGDTVKLVCTHLINRHEEECQKQMSQMIEEFKPFNKVIICGDMNSNDWSQFTDAGYSLANDGSLITFPRNSRSLDNIIVKGLKISDARVIKTKLSDHYPVVCRISSK